MSELICEVKDYTEQPNAMSLLSQLVRILNFLVGLVLLRVDMMHLPRAGSLARPRLLAGTNVLICDMRSCVSQGVSKIVRVPPTLS